MIPYFLLNFLVMVATPLWPYLCAWFVIGVIGVLCFVCHYGLVDSASNSSNSLNGLKDLKLPLSRRLCIGCSAQCLIQQPSTCWSSSGVHSPSFPYSPCLSVVFSVLAFVFVPSFGLVSPAGERGWINNIMRLSVLRLGSIPVSDEVRSLHPEVAKLAESTMGIPCHPFICLGFHERGTLATGRQLHCPHWGCDSTGLDLCYSEFLPPMHGLKLRTLHPG